MKNARSIRPGIISSVAVNSLTWLGIVFYHRLLLIVDDCGLCEADNEIIHSYLFPKNKDKVSVTDTAQLLLQCENAGLVRTYVVGGKRYLEVKKFGQDGLRKKIPKCPLPPEEKGSRREEEGEVNAREIAQENTHTPIIKNQTENTEQQWKRQTIEDSAWVKKVSAITHKPEEQVLKFCAQFIERKNLEGKIGKYKIETLTGYMLADLDKVRSHSNRQEPIENKPIVNTAGVKVDWYTGIKKQFTKFKETGMLQIPGASFQLKQFREDGLLNLSNDEYNHWLDKAKQTLTGKDPSQRVRPVTERDFRSIVSIKNAINKNDLDKMQQGKLESVAANMILRKFYDETSEEVMDGLIEGVMGEAVESQN